jgi:hypothetical protein
MAAAPTCRGSAAEEKTMAERKPWRALFLTWAALRRADTIAEVLGIPSYSVKYFWRGTPFSLTALKYLLQLAHTLLLLLWRRPKVIFVTNPPVFAIAPVYLYALVFRARYVIDFHSGCFLQAQWRRWDRWQRFFARRAALNLAHNAANAKVLEGWGVPLKVLPSLPPRLAAPAGAPAAALSPVPAGTRPLVVYICSFKADEPVAALLEAALGFPGADFRVTGRAPETWRSQLPANVELAGFLSEKDFLDLLARADLVVALTTQSDTLLYGAQEAIALHKPLLLSRTAVLEATFPEGTVFAENTPEALRQGIRAALARREALGAAMAAFEPRYRAQGEALLAEIRAALGGGALS